MTIEVTLDVLDDARFPDRCILCGCVGPGDCLEVATRAAPGWRESLRPSTPPRKVYVPSCSFCRHLMVRQRRLRNVGVVIATFAAIVLYAALFNWYHGPRTGFARVGGLALFLMPYLVWEGLFPLPFRLRASSRAIKYGFEQVTYARAFALLNLPLGHPFFRELAEDVHD